MKRWLYVEVREVSGNHPAGDDQIISFHHVVVEAATEEEAYAAGFAECWNLNADATPETDPDGHFSGSQGLNDYVIDLEAVALTLVQEKGGVILPAQDAFEPADMATMRATEGIPDKMLTEMMAASMAKAVNLYWLCWIYQRGAGK